jgi:hypothetical protein
VVICTYTPTTEDDMTDLDRTPTRVECSCKTCAINAEKLGKTLPLVAEAPKCWLDGIRGPKSSDRKVAHAAVYLAHDPSTVAGWARDRAGVKAL